MCEIFYYDTTIARRIHATVIKHDKEIEEEKKSKTVKSINKSFVVLSL